jgi:hypothetical protein
MLIPVSEYKQPMDSPTEEVVPPSPRTASQQKALNWLVRAFLIWLLVYLMKQGQDGFFARTVDRIDALWVKLIFLNLPLQILLALVTSSCASSERPAVLKTGLWLGGLNAILILVHIVLSVLTA